MTKRSEVNREDQARIAVGVARTRRGRPSAAYLFAIALAGCIEYSKDKGLSREEVATLLDKVIEELGPINGELLTVALAVGIDDGKSEQIRHARTSRHVTNRKAREQAMEIYRSAAWPTKDAAAEEIAQLVNRSIETVRKWLRGVRPSRSA
jgi:DNA-directed RNA polymerase specialized sigma24 family protein